MDKYHVCVDCYIHAIDVILEGQFDSLIRHKYQRVDKENNND